MTQRLKKYYVNEIRSKLKKEFDYNNLYAVPKLEKIIIHRGIGTSNQNQTRLIDSSFKELANITSQKGMITKSKKSIATFKLRKNMPVGIVTTLRGDRMFSFLDRLINLTLPRIRDFNGVKSSSFDGTGNFNMGLSESLMFPEINFNDLSVTSRGMDITIVTTAQSDVEAFHLLKAFKLPFDDESADMRQSHAFMQYKIFNDFIEQNK